MKTTFFFVFAAFILACGLVFCEEYKTEFEDEDKTKLGGIDKTEFDDESAEIDDPRLKRKCKSSKRQY